MGADVHFHTEVKINGKWEHHSEPHVKRDYRLFRLLAGVRGEPSDAMVASKGFPEDASGLTRHTFERDGADAHTPSWLNAEEIARFEDAWARLEEDPFVGSDGRARAKHDRDLEHDVLGCYLFGNSWAGFALYPEDRPKGVEDVRWVFWFDN